MIKTSIDFIRRESQFYIWLLVAFCMPLTKLYMPYLMFFWVLSGFLTFRNININFTRSQWILIISPFLFYFLHLFGLLKTNNLDRATIVLQVKLSFLFAPMVILFLTEKVKKNTNLILKLFVLGNLIVSLICLFFAFKNSIQYNELGELVLKSSVWSSSSKLGFFHLINLRYSYFSYDYLSLIHHPSYFSVYILFSIIIIIDVIRKSSKPNIWHYILIGYFTIFLWMLGSRAAYLSYFAGAFIYGFSIIRKSKKYWIGIAGGILLIIFLGITFSNKQVRNNIRETLELAQGHTINKDSEKRLWLWKSGIEVFKENLWFGVGTGDIDQELQKKYKEYDLKEAREHNYNVHNQYLDIAIKFGVFGLTIFLLWIFYVFYISIRNRQFLFFYFILIMSINFFFEVMLNSIAGVSFFAFFYALLYSRYNRKVIPDKNN